jgi:hypothetical protein
VGGPDSEAEAIRYFDEMTRRGFELTARACAALIQASAGEEPTPPTHHTPAATCHAEAQDPDRNSHKSVPQLRAEDPDPGPNQPQKCTASIDQDRRKEKITKGKTLNFEPLKFETSNFRV